MNMPISSISSSAVAVDRSGGKADVSAVLPATGSAAQETSKTGADVAAPEPSHEQVAQAVKQVNDAFIQQGQNLYAMIEKDKASGINVVKIFDRTTKQEISQFPSKAIIAIAESLGQDNKGKVQLMHVSA